MKLNPPETFTTTELKHRKWWQIWKPLLWEEEITTTFDTVINCEGKSLNEIYDEAKDMIRS